MIHYKINPQLDFAAVLDLYASVGWFDPSGRRWAYHCLYSGFVGISAVPASGDWPEPSSADVGKI